MHWTPIFIGWCVGFSAGIVWMKGGVGFGQKTWVVMDNMLRWTGEWFAIMVKMWI